MKALSRHVPDQAAPRGAPGPAAPFLPTCPMCRAATVPGRVTVHGTVLSFLCVGLSYEHGWFQPAVGGPEVDRLATGEHCPVCRCPRCGFVGVRADPPSPP